MPKTTIGVLQEEQIMTTQVTATVVGGMLKPDESLPLAEQTRVNLTIEPIVEKLEPTKPGNR